MLVSYSSNSKICIFINNGSGSFLPKVEYSAGVTPLRIKVIDLDNDGFKEIVAANLSTELSLFKNNGDGTFAARSVITTSESYQYGLDVADMDGDGYLDLIVSSSEISLYKVSIYFGKNDGTYDLPLALAISNEANIILAKDIDADGAIDLVVPVYNGKTEVYLNKN